MHVKIKKKNATISFPVYYFLLPKVEKVLLLGQIFEMEIFMDLLAFRSPEYKNHIFSGWFVWVCVRMPVISITQNKLQQKLQI